MPKKTLRQFSVSYLQILNPLGKVLDHSQIPSPNLLRRMYRNMLFQREFDAKCVSMQRQGRMGTYAAATGQEAMHVGTAAALEARDWVAPCFREQGVYLYRGIPAKTLFTFFMGSEEGNRIPKEKHTLPYCVPCATQLLHAVGLAQAAKIKQDPVAVMTYLGDGATSEGDFHEAMNWAAVAQVPVVFFVQNNQFAISTPLSKQFHNQTLAQRAIAYDMPGLQVDGNDVLAVYQASREALDRARTGGGPSLIEGVSYRLAAHTTSDDPSRYRKDSDMDPWHQLDPLLRFEGYLTREEILHPNEKELWLKEMRDQLRQEADAAEAICSRLTVDEMFQYLFHNMPPGLQEQRDELLSILETTEESLHA